MSFVQNIFKSKLNTFTFVVFPLVIAILIVVLFYFSYLTNNPVQEKALIQSSQQSSNLVLDQNSSTLIATGSIKNSSTKASFDDLEKPKSATKLAISSVTAKTSPIASTPELDASEILSLLDKVEQYSDNDDAALDNQILEN